MTEEERREMMRSNYAAQMNMLGYDASGNPMDMVHVVRCRDCKYYDRRCFTCENDVLLIKIDDCGCHPPFRVDDDWFCADGERRNGDG